MKIFDLRCPFRKELLRASSAKISCWTSWTFEEFGKQPSLAWEPPSVNKDHAALMTSRMGHVDEIYNRACVYHRRADQALAHGDSHEAEHIYQHGSLYLLKAEPAFLYHHPEVSQAVVRKRLLAKKLGLVMGYEIAAKTTYKPTPSEVNNQSWVLEEVNDMPDHEKAVAYLNKGLRHKSQANGSRKANTANKLAAYAFLQAYTLRPGWGRVDHELDMLEVSEKEATLLMNTTSIRGWRLHDWNVLGVLDSFRYKERDLA